MTGSEFEIEATKRRSTLVGELWGFLRQHKKWWLLPILIVIVVSTAIVILGGTGAGPLIYTLF
jgi:hypothetical protein